MRKILTLGFDKPFEYNNFTDYILAMHGDKTPVGMSHLEYYAKCDFMANATDILLVNGREGGFSESEIVILISAYKASTPIFYIGEAGSTSMLQFMFTNWFNNVEAALDHIQAYY